MMNVFADLDACPYGNCGTVTSPPLFAPAPPKVGMVPGLPYSNIGVSTPPITAQNLFPTTQVITPSGAKVMADSGPPGQTAAAVKQWLDVFTNTAKEVDSYLIQRKQGSLPQQQVYYPPSDSGNKTLIYVGIGLVGLVGLALVFGKKRR